MMDIHCLAAYVVVLISLLSTAIYVVDTIKGKTKPHIFSWLVWAVVMGIGGALALFEGATAGALAIGNASFWCFIIALLALRYGEKKITRSDWILFLAALAIIPIWTMTKEPLSAAVLAVVIDFCAFIPTFRKAWHKPEEENLKAFIINVIISVFRLLSLSPHTLTSSLYPTAVLCLELSLVALLVFRRRALSFVRAIE